MATKKQLEKRIVELEAAVAERDERISTLETRLAKIEALLMRSSANLGLLPSKNPPHVKPGRKNKPAGGQNGHQSLFLRGRRSSRRYARGVVPASTSL
jgi:uncharacterized coiled-coil protein SlyX